MTTADWSGRWRVLLDDGSPGAALRASRGRAYQRSGRVTDLRWMAGAQTGRVQGGRSTPYQVEVGVPVLAEGAWAHVVRAIASQVRHGARLLAGQAPEGLEEELAAHGVALFPHPAEVATSCGCSDPAAVCKHVAAVMEDSADALDADPFLLLRLRGRGRDRLLAEMAAARRAGSRIEEGEPLAALAGAAASPQDWTALRAPLEDADLVLDRGAGVAGGEVRPVDLLGDPAGWAGGVSAADLFGPLIDRAAAWARGSAGAGAVELG